MRPALIDERAEAASVGRQPGGVSIACLCLALTACGGLVPTSNSDDTLGTAARKAWAGAAADEVIVVLWPTADRKQLESDLSRGPVAVSLDEGGLRLRPDCHLSGEYGYRAFTLTESSIRIAHLGKDGAGLPLAGVELGAQASAGATAHLVRDEVGQYVLGATPAAGTGCDGVTHVVRQASVGAFVLRRADEGAASGGVDLSAVAPVSAKTERSDLAEDVLRDGDPARCQVSTTADAAPPPGCSAIVSIRLAAFAPGDAAEPTPEIAPPAPGSREHQLVGKWRSVFTPGEKSEDDAEVRIDGETDYFVNHTALFTGTLAVGVKTDGGRLAITWDLRFSREWQLGSGPDGQLTEKLLDMKAGPPRVTLDGAPVEPATLAAQGVNLPDPGALLPVGMSNTANLRFPDDAHMQIQDEGGVETFERI